MSIRNAYVALERGERLIESFPPENIFRFASELEWSTEQRLLGVVSYLLSEEEIWFRCVTSPNHLSQRPGSEIVLQRDVSAALSSQMLFG